MIKQSIKLHEEITYSQPNTNQSIPDAMKIVTELYNIRIGDTLFRKTGSVDNEMILESFNTTNPPTYMGQPCILKCKTASGANTTYSMAYAINEIDWDKTLVGD